MRTKKSIINMATSIVSQIVIILLGFISRRVLIYSVGVEYLGINGLMTNILTIFSLAESGIGLVIGYNLYAPLAKNDTEQIKSLMLFYKRAYNILALGTAIIGLIFYPFLPFFLTGNTVGNTTIIYFLFLFSSVSSYLFSYKVTLNNSDQNKYLFTVVNTITQIFVLIIKVLVLYFTKDYLLFLVIDIVTNLVKNIVFSYIVDRRYPYLKEKNVKKLDKDIKQKMFQNIKALFITKLGYIVSQCSDNLVISSFVSVSSLGLYSNYTTLITSVTGFVSTFTSSIVSSMGNLIVSEDTERAYIVYKRINFINYWLYTFSAICLLCLIEPFIEIWLGKEFILDKGILISSVLLFYFKGENSAIEMVKSAAGLFKPDRYVTLIEAVFNLVMSIILAQKYGILGVIIGTLVSYIFLSYWIRAYIVYKYLFGKVFINNIVECLKHFSIFAITGFIMYIGSQRISIGSNIYFNFIVKCVFVVGITNILFIKLFHKTSEFGEVKGMLMRKIRKNNTVKGE